MSVFELWANACASQDGLLFYDLESETGREETGLFMTKAEYFFEGRKYFTSPVFHVWIDGKCVCSTLSYVEAYDIYARR